MSVRISSSGSIGIGSSLASGTVGSILFVGTGPVIAQNNANLFWDNTNLRLGLFTNTPTDPVDFTFATTAATAPASGSATVVYSGSNLFPALDNNYTFHVYAYKQVGPIRQRSSSFRTLTCSSVAASGDYRIDLTWAASTNADGYLILEDDDASGNAFGVGWYVVGTTTFTYNSATILINDPVLSSSTLTGRVKIDKLGNIVMGATTTGNFASKIYVKGASNLQCMILEAGGSVPTMTVYNSGRTKTEFAFDPSGYFEVGADSITGTEFAVADGIRGAGPASIVSGGGVIAHNIVYSNKSFCVGTSVTAALLNFKAGTATTATAPIHFTMAGSVVLTTPVSGIMETDTDNIYLTKKTAIREAIPGVLFTQTADASVTNTTTETSIIGTGVGTLTLPANFFVAGKTIRITMSGVYSTVAVTGDTVTIKIKYGTTVLASKATTSLLTGATNNAWFAHSLITCRSTGATGTVQVGGSVRYQVASAAVVEDELNNGAATTTLDTTASSLLDITVTHSAANASNTVKSLVGAVEVLY